jgi:hypothetical protein
LVAMVRATSKNIEPDQLPIFLCDKRFRHTY